MITILIVDDAEFLRMRITKILAGHGYEMLTADNGLKAVRIYKESRPDVVLLDVTMPEMDGLKALKEIRAFDPNARVIMLTALGQNTVAMEALQSGAQDFLVKPFEPERVLAAIEKVTAA
jgi:two-component system chemotaxis response regulator CheY